MKVNLFISNFKGLPLFLFKLLLFSLGGLLLFSIKSSYLLYHSKYKKLVNGTEIYKSIEKSKQKNRKAKILILGDSVGMQLFSNNNYNDSICSLSCNQSISLAGFYLLLENFITQNPQVEKVILIYSPKSFKNNLNQQYTYHYFLKPFYNSEFKHRFSGTVTNQVAKIPFFYLSQFPPILTSDWAPDWQADWDSQHMTGKYFMSSISNEYLSKMIEFCNKYSVQFIILPTPTKISYKGIVDDYQKNNSFKNYDFNRYFSKVLYLPDSCFLDDVHLKHPDHYRKAYFKMINDLQNEYPKI